MNGHPDTGGRHVILILTDQHARYAAGTYGSPVVQTPSLDRLAASGTVFEAASCASPMCVPSRASLMTGRFVHEIGAWDNAHPYHGQPPGWAHALGDSGVRTAVIGKMHFRSAEDDTGFDEVLLPMDVAGGVGDVFSLVRDDMPARPALADLVREAGPGQSPYAAYDRAVARAACNWLKAAPLDERWALTVSFATPHHPLLAPPEFWGLYEDPDLPVAWEGVNEEHPYSAELRRVMGVDVPFSEEETRRARRAYFALCTLADSLIGEVLDQIDERGLREDSLILYSSDHGCSMGERGLWWKHNLYEESVGVPLVASGPGFAPGRREPAPVSQTSVYATLLEALGVEVDDAGTRAPSLTDASAADDSFPLGGFSEYHGMGASSAAFMLRTERWKYICFASQPPQLFDLANDPDELVNLATDRDHEARLRALDARLRSLIDPEAIDRRARADQQALIAANGGREAVLAQGFKIPYTPVPDHG